MVSLYKSLISPHLEYCVVTWSPHYQKDKILLQRIQTFHKNDPQFEEDAI